MLRRTVLLQLSLAASFDYIIAANAAHTAPQKRTFTLPVAIQHGHMPSHAYSYYNNLPGHNMVTMNCRQSLADQASGLIAGSSLDGHGKTNIGSMQISGATVLATLQWPMHSHELTNHQLTCAGQHDTQNLTAKKVISRLHMCMIAVRINKSDTCNTAGSSPCL